MTLNEAIPYNSLAIVIPAFNEDKTVGDVVKNCAKHCDVLVIDDGSTDELSLIHI